MWRRMIIMLLAVGVLFGAIFGFKLWVSGFIAQKIKVMANQAQTVSTAAAEYQDWQIKLNAIGTLRAVNGADLSSQVAGIVGAIHFDSGEDVKAGTLLIELKAADDLSKLDTLKAQAALAQLTYDRDQKQLKVQAVSQQNVDTDAQNLKAIEAQVAEQEATISYKFIRAPFDGRLGIRQVDLGQYLAAGTAMVTLQSLDPIFVDFYLPQQSLDQIRVGQAVTVTVDASPGQDFPGEITAINPKIDVTTRNVQVRATLKNPDHKLLPGMFASAAVDVGAPQRYITLPQTAIAYNSYGETVYVLDNGDPDPNGKPASTAHQVFVTTGPTRGDLIAVLTGVKQGDIVVSTGQMKLHNGSAVTINNDVRPTTSADPMPVDH